MSTDKPLVAFAHIMLSLETKLVSVYSNAAWGDLNMFNVELFIQEFGEPVQISESTFYNLKELTRIPTPKQTIMSTKPELPNYTQLSTDKFSEISKMIFSENIDKVALADAIIEYGSYRYKDGEKLFIDSLK
jgi:hypothetical protein